MKKTEKNIEEALQDFEAACRSIEADQDAIMETMHEEAWEARWGKDEAPEADIYAMDNILEGRTETEHAVRKKYMRPLARHIAEDAAIRASLAELAGTIADAAGAEDDRLTADIVKAKAELDAAAERLAKAGAARLEFRRNVNGRVGTAYADAVRHPSATLGENAFRIVGLSTDGSTHNYQPTTGPVREYMGGLVQGMEVVSRLALERAAIPKREQARPTVSDAHAGDLGPIDPNAAAGIGISSNLKSFFSF